MDGRKEDKKWVKLRQKKQNKTGIKTCRRPGNKQLGKMMLGSVVFLMFYSWMRPRNAFFVGIYIVVIVVAATSHVAVRYVGTETAASTASC